MQKSLEKFVKKAWWAVVAMGVLSILFGLAIFFWPGATLMLIFSIFALIVGAFAVVKALGSTKENRLWWLTLLFGVLCLGFGVYVLVDPNIAVLTFAIILSIVIFVQALGDLIAASYSDDSTDKGFLATTGIIGFIVGFIVLFYPDTATITLGWIVGLYVIFRGISLLVYAYRTNNEFRKFLKKSTKTRK